MEISQILTEIAQSIGSSDTELSHAISSLDCHWISSIDDWAAILPHRRASLGLPDTFLSSLDARVSPSLSTGQGKHPETGWVLRWSQFARSLVIDAVVYEFQGLQPVAQLIATLEKAMGVSPVRLLDHQGLPVAEGLKISEFLLPKACILLGEGRAVVLKSIHYPFLLEDWLASLNMQKHFDKFLEDEFLDFLPLLFLDAAALAGLGIADAGDQAVLMRSIHSIVHSSSSELLALWLRLMGDDGDDASIDIEAFRSLSIYDIQHHADKGRHSRLFRECVLTKAGSVEKGFRWLRGQGFVDSALSFARIHFPYYLFPILSDHSPYVCVLSPQERAVYHAVSRLGKSATFQAKALNLWLRDLGLEHHNLTLAKLRYCSIDSLQKFSTKDARFFQDWEIDRIITGLADMAGSRNKKYFPPDSFVDICNRYSLSSDMLADLTDEKLKKLGVATREEREEILALSDRYRNFIPSTRIFSHLPAVDSISLAQYSDPLSRPAPISTSRDQHKNAAARKKGKNTYSQSIDELLSFINKQPVKAQPRKKTPNHTKPSPPLKSHSVPLLTSAGIPDIPQNESIIADSKSIEMRSIEMRPTQMRPNGMKSKLIDPIADPDAQSTVESTHIEIEPKSPVETKPLLGNDTLPQPDRKPLPKPTQPPPSANTARSAASPTAKQPVKHPDTPSRKKAAAPQGRSSPTTKPTPRAATPSAATPPLPPPLVSRGGKQTAPTVLQQPNRASVPHTNRSPSNTKPPESEARNPKAVRTSPSSSPFPRPSQPSPSPVVLARPIPVSLDKLAPISRSPERTPLKDPSELVPASDFSPSPSPMADFSAYSLFSPSSYASKGSEHLPFLSYWPGGETLAREVVAHSHTTPPPLVSSSPLFQDLRSGLSSPSEDSFFLHAPPREQRFPSSFPQTSGRLESWASSSGPNGHSLRGFARDPIPSPPSFADSDMLSHPHFERPPTRPFF